MHLSTGSNKFQHDLFAIAHSTIERNRAASSVAPDDIPGHDERVDDDRLPLIQAILFSPCVYPPCSVEAYDALLFFLECVSRHIANV
jgi:hypothetical protein